MILTLTAGRQYLALPAYRGEMERSAMRLVRVLNEEGRLLGQFLLPIGDEVGEPDWYAFLPINNEKGRVLRVEADCGESYTRRIYQTDVQTLPAGAVSAQDAAEDRESAKAVSGDAPEQGGDPSGTGRPSLHYTPPYGWLNDPNGLICVDGVYHLFHQHNPVGTMWGNMSWGHAITRDLVHYEWVGEALLPDEHGVMYSGCAIRNSAVPGGKPDASSAVPASLDDAVRSDGKESGAFGLPEDAILFFYTTCNDRTRLGMGAGDEQRLAYSLDGGNTLRKVEDWCIPMMDRGNRDPKVFRHEESGAWIMTLYLADARFAILRSEDLEHWTLTQTLDEPPMWECPDLVPLGDQWAFLSADGFYYIGSFDGYTFTKETPMQTLYGGKRPWLPYAAQSWTDAGGRVLTTAWLRVPNRGDVYTGAMSLPREFTLGIAPDGAFYIRQRFAGEVTPYVTSCPDGSTRVDDAYIRETIAPDGRYLTVEVI